MTEISVANLSALQLVQAARAVQLETAAGEGDAPAASFGPAPAELAAIDPSLVTESRDGLTVNIASVAGLAWAAAAEAGDRAAALETRVTALERQLAEFL